MHKNPKPTPTPAPQTPEPYLRTATNSSLNSAPPLKGVYLPTFSHPPSPSNLQSPPKSPPPPLRRNNAKHPLNLPHRRIPLAIAPQQLQKPLQHHAAPLVQRAVVQPRGALEGALGERQARAPEGVGGEGVHEALEGYEADVGRVGVEGDAGGGAGGC